MSAAGKVRKPRGPQGPRISSAGSREARTLAAAILDVLAGGRTPNDAAAALGVSAPRYYALEARALEGLLAACEARKKGRSRAPEREIDALRKQVESLKRECARKQALVRAAQRTVGLPPPPPPAPKAKRRRRPVARALRAAAVLRSDEPAEPRVSGEEPANSDRAGAP